MIQQEQDIIKVFIDYTKDKWDIEFSNNNAYNEVKRAFNYISNDNLPILRLEQKIEKKNKDYERISKPYVRGESYGCEGGGKPMNSYEVPYDERIHYLRQEMDKEISDLTIEKVILEKQLADEFEMFENLLILLPNQIQRQVMLMAFLEKRKYADIAITLNYSYNTICQYVSNAIKDISKKIKQYRKI